MITRSRRPTAAVRAHHHQEVLEQQLELNVKHQVEAKQHRQQERHTMLHDPLSSSNKLPPLPRMPPNCGRERPVLG